MLSPCLFDASLLFTFGFIWWGWDPRESKMWQLFYDLSLSCDPIVWVEFAWCNQIIIKKNKGKGIKATSREPWSPIATSREPWPPRYQQRF
jgi:hypothetical protein